MSVKNWWEGKRNMLTNKLISKMENTFQEERRFTFVTEIGKIGLVRLIL